MKFNIVFQGGGAKLLPLTTAIQALQLEIKNNPNFDVKKVAGSSAGSIAAMILSLDVDVDTLIQHFRSDEGQASFSNAFPRIDLTGAIFKLSRGVPLLSRTNLEGLLHRIIELSGRDASGQEIILKYPISIAVTNLKKSRAEFLEFKKVSAPELIRCVADSCSIPFILKNHRSHKNWNLVDGGLFENLPVSKFATNAEDLRKTLAFSFEDRPVQNIENPPSVRDYTKMVISTAIDGNINPSIKALGEDNVYPIPTDLGTLDFAKAHRDYVESAVHFQSHVKAVQNWLSDVTRRELLRAQRVKSNSSSMIPSNFLDVRRSVGQLFKARSSDNVRKTEVTVYIQLNTLCHETSPSHSDYELMYTRIVYEVPEDGLDCLLITTAYHTPNEAGKYSDFELFDANSQRLSLVVLPIETSDLPDQFVSLAIFPNKKISKNSSATVTLIKKEMIKGCMTDLISDGVDYVEIAPQSIGTIEKSHIFVGIPNELTDNYELSHVNESYDETSEGFGFIAGKTQPETPEITPLKSVGFSVKGLGAVSKIGENEMFVCKISKVAD